MTLDELTAGESAVIKTVGGEGALRQHFLDMGLIPNTMVTLVKFAPMGDPMEFKIYGYELTLRKADANKIEVEKTDPDTQDKQYNKQYGENKKRSKRIMHPGLGEGGKYHVKSDEDALPKNETITFALAGNQNSGKTTLFNCLTGANQRVGNFPGVTVDRKDGVIKGFPGTLITDLPGIYSMSPYTNEEIVTREYILNEKPKGIINILDATNIERNLYLTMQLMELDIPMVVALNMMDEVRENGGSIYINELEERLGVPVVPISAAKNEGIKELVDHAMHIAKYKERPGRIDFCGEGRNGGAVHRCIHSIMHLIENKHGDIPIRFAATKLAEGDTIIRKSLNLKKNESDMLENIISQMETESGMDRASAVADMRFGFIHNICGETVVRPKESKERIRSERIDRILTGKYTAIPAFIVIMGLIFFLTFNVIGKLLSDRLEAGIELITNLASEALEYVHVNPVIHSLIIDGIFEGVGSVLSFLPVIVTLFFFLSMLEDSGYMARIAFIMDRLLRKIGLSGRSIVPMLIGFGCTVPGVMASRTLSSERDRKMTILLTPFMSCSAKLPVYGFFTSIFFPEHAAAVMIGLYFTGIIMG
ncbi:MAG: ferrous iron transport protein B, partial [Oscillospiraceae bacterium]|nr:ferrous iron transport protein B [Oscillospiraceae bacterium]